ncbi:MAG: leucine-rich repeat domain-containing protein [Holosporales bacterium]|jgi:hypothetical protein|nr:leucine-rich repeat domain-containing protein [Holosporales bacterium]
MKKILLLAGAVACTGHCAGDAQTDNGLSSNILSRVYYGVKDSPWQAFCSIVLCAAFTCSAFVAKRYLPGFLGKYALRVSSTASIAVLAYLCYECRYILVDDVYDIKRYPYVLIAKEVDSLDMLNIIGERNMVTKHVRFEAGSQLTEIEDRAFENCVALESIILPGNVRSIGDEAFAQCCSLTRITLPPNVNIGWWAFWETGLQHVYFSSAPESNNMEGFLMNKFYYTNLPRGCTASSPNGDIWPLPFVPPLSFGV